MGPTSRTAAAVAKKKVRSRTCARVDARFDGQVVELPEATRNFYVDGHVPQPH